MAMQIRAIYFPALGITGGLAQAFDHRIDRRIWFPDGVFEKIPHEGVKARSPQFCIATALLEKIVIHGEGNTCHPHRICASGLYVNPLGGDGTEMEAGAAPVKISMLGRFGTIILMPYTCLSTAR